MTDKTYQKKITATLKDGRWDVRIDVKEGELPITPREYNLFQRALRVMWARYKRQLALSARKTQKQKETNDGKAASAS